MERDGAVESLHDDYMRTYAQIDEWVRTNRMLGPMSQYMNYGYRTQWSNPMVRAELRLMRTAFAPLLASGAPGPVLEVGAGRCGNVTELARAVRGCQVVALDLLGANLTSQPCTRAAARGVCRVQGNAQTLPFSPSAMGAVVSLESMHSYPDPAGFFTEAVRITAPGGWVIVADFAPPGTWNELTTYVGTLQGCQISELVELTDGVLRARRHAGSVMRRLARATLSEGFREFLALPGTRMFDAFSSGALRYKALRLRVGEPAHGMDRKSALRLVSDVETILDTPGP